MKKTVDVLVIGTGGAGCRAAIEAADRGVSVLLVSKKEIGHSGATSYPVAEMAGYNAGDVSNPYEVQKHFDDIMKAGQGMADEKLAAIVAARAPETIDELEAWGVPFEMEEDGYYIFKSCFSNYPRTHVIKGHGEPITHALKLQIEKRRNIEVLTGTTIMGLYVRDNHCTGAYGYQDGEILYIEAKAVVLTTGGSGQAFERNMNPVDVTGSGYAMAYEAGAELVNMEFMQIGMGFSHPVVNIFNGYIWEGRPKLLDKDGEEIFSAVLPEGLTSDEVMHEHRKHFPFSSSDISKYLEVVVQTAIKEGRGTKNRGIRADLTHMTDEYIAALPDDCGIHHMWGIARDFMKSRNVDLLKDEVEVAVYAHAINGGVRISADAMSSLPGLFAAGECAGGPHGADRLGGNMMVTCQVFGKIAGSSAAEYAISQAAIRTTGEEAVCQMTDDPQYQRIMELLHKAIDSKALLKRLRIAAQDHLLVGRNEEGLTSLLNTVNELKRELMTAPAGQNANLANIDFYHMLITVGIMAESALQRKESRGSHHRSDFPQTDPKYGSPIIIKK
ncbi:MAG: FAD-binding protein [Lachnospiraceae bacterium]|nr:FAD-binding protein [Lachnospiraceae bacterium]